MIIFKLICYLTLILFSLVYLFDFLKTFQLNEYKIPLVLRDLSCKIMTNLFCLIVMAFYSIVIAVIRASIWLLILTYILNVAFLCFSKIDFKAALKIKYTKRMIRLLLIILMLLFAIYSIVWLFLPAVFICKTMWILVFVSGLVGIISNFIILPIEWLIKRYYFHKAKKSLMEHRMLTKIGVTGSFGKTSTKEILSTLLSEKYNVLAVPKSFNTPMGISKTINSGLTNAKEVFVCEMGARKVGEIRELCQFVDPHIGVVTSVGRQHTNTFGNIEGVYSTKKELPDFLVKKTCVFNLQNHYTAKMYETYAGERIGVFVVLARANIGNIRKIIKKINMCIVLHDLKDKNINILYEKPHKNNYYAKRVKNYEFGTCFDVYEGFEKVDTFFVCLLGGHNVINSLLSIAVARKMGLTWNKIKLGFAKVKQIDARLQKIRLDNGAIVINNGYNSNLDSAKESLKVMTIFDRMHRVIVTPGLVETSDDFGYNREFGKLIAKYATDIIIVKNKNKKAILAGLSESCFDMNRVFFASSFVKVKNVLNGANENYVFLIENDLPDNYK